MAAVKKVYSTEHEFHLLNTRPKAKGPWYKQEVKLATEQAWQASPGKIFYWPQTICKQKLAL